jgi:hypothetical protein
MSVSDERRGSEEREGVTVELRSLEETLETDREMGRRGAWARRLAALGGGVGAVVGRFVSPLELNESGMAWEPRGDVGREPG